MKIIRHTARDMRQALRAVREQLGEDAVILSSRRTGDGVEVTAAVDFDASTLEAGGFSGTPATAAPLPARKAPPQIIDATPVSAAPRKIRASAPRSGPRPHQPPGLSAPPLQCVQALRNTQPQQPTAPRISKSTTMAPSTTLPRGMPHGLQQLPTHPQP